MDTQSKLEELKQEVRALKVAFQQSATKLNLITKQISFSTSKNTITQSSGGYDFSYEGQERVVVTLDTASGANTIAKLEISGNFDFAPIVRQVPYLGGARWVVSNSPKLSGTTWSATTYEFVAQTLVNGTLSAKMIWE